MSKGKESKKKFIFFWLGKKLREKATLKSSKKIIKQIANKRYTIKLDVNFCHVEARVRAGLQKYPETREKNIMRQFNCCINTSSHFVFHANN